MHFHRNIKLVANCLPLFRGEKAFQIKFSFFIFLAMEEDSLRAATSVKRNEKAAFRLRKWKELKFAAQAFNAESTPMHRLCAYYAENPPARDRAESPFTEHWLASQYSVLGNRRGAESEFYDIFRAYLDIESDISTQKILSATHELYWPAQIETKFTSFSRCVWTFWCLNWLLVNAR